MHASMKCAAFPTHCWWFFARYCSVLVKCFRMIIELLQSGILLAKMRIIPLRQQRYQEGK
eukprot:6186059-Pleurochrysis_carterae.AAC.6